MPIPPPRLLHTRGVIDLHAFAWEPPAGMSVAEAWERCPDARWLVERAQLPDRRGRVAVVVAAVRAVAGRVREPVIAPAALDSLTQYAESEDDDALAGVPEIGPATWPPRVRAAALGRVVEALGPASASNETRLVRLMLAHVLADDATPASTMVAVAALARLVAMQAFSGARDELERERRELRLRGFATPADDTFAGHDVCERAFRGALRDMADAVRAAVPAPT